MQKLFIDFETYYDDVYSLRKMTPIEYVLDPRFESLGCSFHIDDAPGYWVDGPNLPAHFATLDWKNSWVLSHNALFDMLILSLRYGVVPGFYGDTLSMARNWLSHSLSSLSLKSIAAYYGMPEKWETVLKLKGVNFQALSRDPDLHRECKAYAIDDGDKAKEIFWRMLRDGFPVPQLPVIDMVIRMATQPRLQLDAEVLTTHLAEVQNAKQELLDKAQLDGPENLMSNDKLAAMLIMMGVHAPTKISPTTGKEAYAFAKTDKEFIALLEHEDPLIQATVAARLGHKSTLEESRTERLIAIQRVAPEAFPIPLKYSGAHTHRFSGDWKINLQNLPRPTPTKPARLREAIRAPKGHVLVIVDANQIEARFNATLAGQEDLMQQFREGIDVYSMFAESIYNKPISKKGTPIERQVGKVSILSLGYGASWQVFQAMLRNQDGITLTDAECISIVMMYRSRYPKIVANWKHADAFCLPTIANHPTQGVLAEITRSAGVDPTWGPMVLKQGAILLPSLNMLRYRDLRHDGRQWSYARGNTRQHIYGAKLVENVIQALAFVHIIEVALRIRERTERLLMPAHQVHDDLIYCVPEKVGEQVGELVQGEMEKSPAWMPDAPLAAEYKVALTYGGDA